MSDHVPDELESEFKAIDALIAEATARIARLDSLVSARRIGESKKRMDALNDLNAALVEKKRRLAYSIGALLRTMPDRSFELEAVPSMERMTKVFFERANLRFFWVTPGGTNRHSNRFLRTSAEDFYLPQYVEIFFPVLAGLVKTVQEHMTATAGAASKDALAVEDLIRQIESLAETARGLRV